MPFMVGKVPVRRTLKYLQAGKLYLKNSIQIFAINYNHKGPLHAGLRDFVFWSLPQVQYKNPNVNVATFVNITPSPFITCFYDTGKKMIIDCENKSKEEILEHLMNVVGKPKDVLQAELNAAEKKDNPANFGFKCEKDCICIVPGQLPCTGVVPVPYHMRGKYTWNKQE